MATSHHETQARRVGLACAAAAALAACLHAWFAYKGHALDEAFVQFRIADRLGEGLGLTWADGDPVERHRSLLHLWLLVAADAVGFEPIRTSRLIGYAAVAIAVLAASVDVSRWELRAPNAITGGALLAISGSLAAAAMGGTEHALVGGLVAVGLLLTIRAVEHPSPQRAAALTAVLTVLILARTDAYPLVFGLLIGASAATGRARPWVLLALVPALALAAQAAHRSSTWGAILPPTGPGSDPRQVVEGLQWVTTALVCHLPLVAAAALGLIRRSNGPLTWTAGLTSALWLVHLVVVGGSPLPGWAALVPILPALGLLAAQGLSPLLAHPPGFALALGALFTQGAVVSATGKLPAARARHSEWYAPPMAHILTEAFGDRSPVLAVERPGVLPYWTGLATVRITETPDLWADRPDVIVFGSFLGGTKPTTAEGRALIQRPDFLEYYQPVRFTARSKLVGRHEAVYYFLREGGAMGLGRSADEVQIPAWFLASPGSWAARWNGEVLATPISPELTNELPGLLLRAGTWEVVDDGPALGVDFRCEGLAATRLSPGPPALQLDAPGHVDLLLWSGTEERVAVQGIVLRRTERPATHRCDPVPSTPWSMLPREIGPGSAWNSPGSMVFGEQGLRVQLDGPVAAEALVLSVDGNDAYVVRWFAGTQMAGRSTVRVANGSGLQPRRVAVPPKARQQGADRFVLEPAGGDGSWSIGAARFTDER